MSTRDTWQTVSEAARICGLPEGEIWRRITDIRPASLYTPEGLSPEGTIGEKLLKGKELTRVSNGTLFI